MNQRHWTDGIKTNLKTCVNVVKVLLEMKMWALIPFLFVLLAIALILYFGKFATPLAPFVYSLF